MKKLIVLIVFSFLTGCQQINGPVAVTDDGDAVFYGDERLERLAEDEKAEPSYTSYANEKYGIEFYYPENWIFGAHDNEGVLDIDISNMTIPEGYDCTDDVVFVGIISTVRDFENNKSFDQWFQENYSPEGFLGGFGGEYEKMEFFSYHAYKVGMMGWETYCPSRGYVIDYASEDAPDRIIEVVISKNPDYLYGDIIVNKIIDSVVLKGYKQVIR